MKVLLPCLVIFTLHQAYGYIVDPGPVVIASRGEVWPKPYQQTKSNYFMIVRPSLFKFELQSETCDILDEALVRYRKIIESIIKQDTHTTNRRELVEHPHPAWRNDNNFDSYLDELTINLKNKCEEKPHPNMVESYKLSVTNGSASLESDSIWGILHGMETFSQLLFAADDGQSLQIHGTEINDKPRYPFRGLLVDTSRHFVHVFTLAKILDGMTYNKLNVFHWHIVDDHSFPYESKTFPELSEKGAFHKDMIYTQEDIRYIIEYARMRGIRTLVEFDTPGHTRSWGISHPEILTACEGTYAGKLGPIDPTKAESYDFMKKLLAEIVEVFPDDYVHLGGDEVGFECWESAKHIQDYMKTKNITKYESLEEEYIQKIVDMVTELKHKSIVWQEVFENGVRLEPGTIVHVWTGSRSKLLNDITKQGLPALLSSCWYLDHLSTGGDWKKFYECEPSDFSGNDTQQALLLGGESCMWAEVVDDTNILQRVFPRASAAAEKLWSEKKVTDQNDAAKRIEEHVCRMRKRGIPAQPPNSAGYCI